MVVAFRNDFHYFLNFFQTESANFCPEVEMLTRNDY